MSQKHRDDEKFTRQLQLVPLAALADTHIDIIGVGAIGSAAGLQLAKMGCGKIRAFDHDSVEIHNLPNQSYWLSHIGIPKVDAFAEVVAANIGGDVVDPINSLWTGAKGQELHGIVVATPDTMEARMNIWKHCYGNINVDLLIDARMGGQEYVVLCIDPKDVTAAEYYEKEFLFSDDEAMDLPCTAKAIVYNVFIVGGIICSLVRKWIAMENGLVEASPLAVAIHGDTVVPMQIVTQSVPTC